MSTGNAPGGNLMIVESPNKIAKIKAILGQGWQVAASVGHIRDLPENEIGVAAPEFEPQYVFSGKGKEITARLKAQCKAASQVYLATDPDREGEAIAWHLKEALKLKSYKRVKFSAINDAVIKQALARPEQIDMKKVYAQEARRVLDRLVGYMVSRPLSLSTGERFSAGRVQSPAVRLVVERERAIQTFKVTNHFGAEVLFNGWCASWNPASYIGDDAEYILDESTAAAAASCRQFSVLESASKIVRAGPPAPFRSATLMQAASTKLGFSPDKTMELAQQLFAAGHINYHRTDKQNLEPESVQAIRDYAAVMGWPLPATARSWPSVAGAQEGHEAIRPIYFELEAAGTTSDERLLYQLIRLRALASQLTDAEYQVTTNVLRASVEGLDYDFEASGKVLHKAGWRALSGNDSAEDETPNEDGEGGGLVPVLSHGSSITADSGRVVSKKTKAPARYTEASLIARLEKAGIGRPSTYPAILKNIRSRGYIVEDKKRKLAASSSGMMLVVALVRNKFSFINLDFTIKLELELDRIAEGKTTYLAVVSDLHSQLVNELGGLSVAFPCPKCGAGMELRPGRDSTNFWGCSAYRDTGCKTSAPDIEGRPGSYEPQGGAATKSKL